MNEKLLDWVSVGTVIATLAGYLPRIAALFAIVWSIMQMIIHWDAFCARVKRWFK